MNEPKALDKGVAVFGEVVGMELRPPNDPKYDARWLITLARGDMRFRFYVGEKTMAQQTARAKVTAPLKGVWGFERTAEGYFNLLREGASVKPGTTVANDMFESVPADPPARNPNADFEQPPEADRVREREEADAKRLVAFRLEMEGDMRWALDLAEAEVRRLCGKPFRSELVTVMVDGEPMLDATGMPVTKSVEVGDPLDGAECRAVVALSATYHIGVKDKVFRASR